MKFECAGCGGHIDAPDELSDTVVECPHCGQDIVVPHVEMEGGQPDGAQPQAEGPPGAPADVELAAPHAITPEEFRAQAQENTKRRRAIFLLLVLVALVAALGVYRFVPPVQEFFNAQIERFRPSEAELLQQEHGWAPNGYYFTGKLQGITRESADWEVKEAAQAYLVVKLLAAGDLFVPSPEEYEKLKGATVLRGADMASRGYPPRSECRQFNPARFTLAINEAGKNAEGRVEGVLINIHHGIHDGFRGAFQLLGKFEAGSDGAAKTEEDGAEQGGEENGEQNEAKGGKSEFSEKPMSVSVAFLVKKDEVEPEALALWLDNEASLKVTPAGGE